MGWTKNLFGDLIWNMTFLNDFLFVQEVIVHTFVTESKNPLILVCFNDFLMQTFIYKHISLSISYDFNNSFYQMDLKLLFIIIIIMFIIYTGSNHPMQSGSPKITGSSPSKSPRPPGDLEGSSRGVSGNTSNAGF